MMAAMMKTMSRIQTLNDPTAANVPAAKMSESPGRKGVTTRPVSQKIMAKRIPYDQPPKWRITSPSVSSKWRKRSINSRSPFMAGSVPDGGKRNNFMLGLDYMTKSPALLVTAVAAFLTLAFHLFPADRPFGIPLALFNVLLVAGIVMIAKAARTGLNGWAAVFL